MVTPSATSRATSCGVIGDHGGRCACAVSTWTKSRRRRLANGRTWTRWSSRRGVVDAGDAADRDVAAGTASDAVVRDWVPAVTTLCPGVDLVVARREVAARGRSGGRPRRCITPRDAALGHARADARSRGR